MSKRKNFWGRILLLGALLIIPAMSGYAAGSLVIGSKTINLTQDNADVMGDGKVNYTASSKTLTLNGASLTSGIAAKGVQGLTVKLVGENTITVAKSAIDINNGTTITLTGAGSLTATSTGGNAVMVQANSSLTIQETSMKVKGKTMAFSGLVGFMGETLIIDNAKVEAEAGNCVAADLQTFTLQNVKIIEPKGGAWNPGNNRFCDSAGKMATRMVLEANSGQEEVASISFGNQKVNLANSNSNVLGDGKVSYDATAKQFTLNNASLTAGINIEGAKGYTFVMQGTNNIATSGQAIKLDKGSDITITGNGQLQAVSSGDTAISINNFSKLTLIDTKVSVKGKIGISGTDGKHGETLMIDSTALTIMADNYALGNLAAYSLLHAKIVKPVEAYWSYDKHQVVDVDGKAVTHLVIESKSDNEGKKLGMLAIGDTYIELNKSKKDVLGDGTVSYDAERRTLTLNNANIVTEQNSFYMQEASDLTINVVGNCNITSTKKTAMVLFYDSHVTITGSGTLNISSPENTGIYLLYKNDLIFKDIDVNVSGLWAIAGINGTSEEHLEIVNANVEATGSAEAINSVQEVVLKQAHLAQPQNAVWSDQEHRFLLDGQKVKHLKFAKGENTAVSHINSQAGMQVALNHGVASITAPAGTQVSIYTIDGRLAGSCIMPHDGKQQVQLGAGTYIIHNSNGQNIKLIAL